MDYGVAVRLMQSVSVCPYDPPELRSNSAVILVLLLILGSTLEGECCYADIPDFLDARTNSLGREQNAHAPTFPSISGFTCWLVCFPGDGSFGIVFTGAI